jgi:hypothetical protein
MDTLSWDPLSVVLPPRLFVLHPRGAIRYLPALFATFQIGITRELVY